jgi:hypothetical protein
MEEVVGSIPTRSTKLSNNLDGTNGCPVKSVPLHAHIVVGDDEVAPGTQTLAKFVVSFN